MRVWLVGWLGQAKKKNNKRREERVEYREFRVGRAHQDFTLQGYRKMTQADWQSPQIGLEFIACVKDWKGYVCVCVCVCVWCALIS